MFYNQYSKFYILKDDEHWNYILNDDEVWNFSSYFTQTSQI